MRITPLSQQLANLQNPILPSALAADRAVRQEMVKDNASQLRQARSNVESVLRREVGYNPMPGVASTVSDLQSTQTQLSNMRMQRMASSGSDVAMAIPRFYDPMEQWDLSGYPWNMADEGHRHKLHKWLRLYYSTHRLLPQLVDIYTRFPLAGTSLYSKDLQLTKFYEDLFLGELEYEDFLVSLGREFWLIGEAFPLGRFNEDLGIWEDEELLDPENMVIENIPILGGVQFKVNPPDYLKKIVREKSPAKFYKLLEQTYPELVPYLRRDEAFPVSDVLLKHVAFKVTPFDAHGTPLLLRGLRTLMHEEKLLSAMDATAERGYAPFLLAKLGIQDMGPNSMPWIPGADEIAALRDDIDVALSQDFRLLVHHYGLDIENIFGREDMPDFGNDFDRIDRWLMQIFGITPSLLGGAGADAPYATSALNAEQLNQMLRTYQKFLKNHYDSRAAVVAEAQGHYDYEKRGPQPLDAKVLTPVGWTTMGDLSLGDQVVGQDGLPTSVVEVIDQGMQSVYRVTFSDGSSTECAGNHNWHVLKHADRHPGRVHVLTIDEIREGGGCTFPNGLRKYMVPHVDPIQFEGEPELSVDPYLLGLLLGDGCLGIGNGSVSLATHLDDFDETISSIEEILPAMTSCVRHMAHTTSPSIRFAREGGLYRNPLATSLKEMGLWQVRGEKKFVPESYLRASIDQRLALLQGLMDSDGSSRLRLGGGVISDFATSSSQLAHAVMDLVGSLGGSASMQEKKLRREHLLEIVVTIKRLPQGMIPHRLSRKVDVWVNGRSERSGRYRHIKSIELVGRKPVRCITVDNEDHLYVTDDYIVTHNSTRVPIMEKVIVTDPETNKQYIETRHKLMYPKMEFSTLDVRDEATERQFLQTLRAMGVPISDEKLMVAVNFEFKDSLDEMQEEMLQKTIAQQMAKMLTYKICQAKGLPIPMDLKAEVEGQVMGGQPPPGGGGGPPPGGGGPPPGGGGGGGMVMPPPPEDLMGGGLGPGGQGGAPPGGGPPPAGPLNAQRGTVPEASNERRPGMPQFSHTAMVEDDEGNISYDVWKLSVEEVEQAYREAKALNLEFEVAKRERRIAAESGRTIIPEDYDRENLDYTLCEECGRDHSQEKISSKIPHKKLREFEQDG